MEFLTYLAKESGAIGQAPFIFAIAVALAGVLAFGIAQWAFKTKFDHADSRLKLRDDRIADLERKLGELREVAESPPPKVEAHGNGDDNYSLVIRQLVADYIFDLPGQGDPDILAGRELPPLIWMNDQLAARGAGWRITNVRGPIAEIGPA